VDRGGPGGYRDAGRASSCVVPTSWASVKDDGGPTGSARSYEPAYTTETDILVS
jgi:hypothetical protein